MSVPAIALYASPPGNICSGSNFSSHIAAHGSFDSDFGARGSSSSVIPKSIVGGRHASVASSFTRGDELGSVWHDKSEELSCSYLNSSYLNSVKIRSHSPVSVFQGPEMGSRSGTETAVSRKSPWESPSKERLFRGMVRESLGSSVEYDSSRSCVEGGAEIGLSEFNFYMEDVFVGSQSDCEPYAKEMLSEAQSRHKIFCEEFVMKAFYEAEKAHRGQMRASGDPYLRHCVETAILLANVGANATVVAAGLLHDTYDDSFVDHNYIFQRFGDDVADLVDGVTKLSQLSKLARENNTADKIAEAGRLHMMFLAMADARAVLIKLADRLHNMMTLGALPPIKQQRFAKETLEVFAPLANRLGISSWKEQLENLCFKHLNPEQHMELSSKLVKSFDEAMIASSKERLEKALNTKGISYHCLSGRHKSLYSIYSKMLKKKLNIDEVHDIHGLRLIVENESDCFKALNIVHALWPKVDGRFKNYISHPKPNGYQSLHTVVLSEDGVPLEIQIRTKEMHLQSEYGFAAHWRYKEGDCKYSKFMLQKVEWARWVLTWQCESMSNGCLSFLGDIDSIRPPCPFPSHWKDCPHSYKPLSDHEGPIMVILLENDKMSVQEFPAHSTIMDLFERLGRQSSRWNNYSFPRKVELRPKLNHEAVAPQDRFKKLKMGDVVELTPAIPDKSLPGYREELRRMYDKGLAVHCRGPLRN